jgi:hypothetical protein
VSLEEGECEIKQLTPALSSKRGSTYSPLVKGELEGVYLLVYKIVWKR